MQMVHELMQKQKLFSLCQYGDDTVIISGGIENESATNRSCRLTFEQGNEPGRLLLSEEKTKYLLMKKTRFNHTSTIVKGHIFHFFGQ